MRIQVEFILPKYYVNNVIDDDDYDDFITLPFLLQNDPKTGNPLISKDAKTDLLKIVNERLILFSKYGFHDRDITYNLENHTVTLIDPKLLIYDIELIYDYDGNLLKDNPIVNETDLIKYAIWVFNDLSNGLHELTDINASYGTGYINIRLSSFEIDYLEMSKQRTKIIEHELISKALQPSRINKWLDYHLENGEDICNFEI